MKLILPLFLIFLSCGFIEDRKRAAEEFKSRRFVVEMVNCDGSVSRSWIATNLVWRSRRVLFESEGHTISLYDGSVMIKSLD